MRPRHTQWYKTTHGQMWARLTTEVERRLRRETATAMGKDRVMQETEIRQKG